MKFTRTKADFENKIEGKFFMYDGEIQGINLELVLLVNFIRTFFEI